MDPSALAVLDKLSPIVDRLGSFGLVVLALITGARGVWVWGSLAKEKDAMIARLERKLDAQERLIDRLSGVADRSTSMATTAVVHQVHERRHREDAA